MMHNSNDTWGGSVMTEPYVEDIMQLMGSMWVYEEKVSFGSRSAKLDNLVNRIKTRLIDSITSMDDKVCREIFSKADTMNGVVEEYIEVFRVI